MVRTARVRESAVPHVRALGDTRVSYQLPRLVADTWMHFCLVWRSTGCILLGPPFPLPLSTPTHLAPLRLPSRVDWISDVTSTAYGRGGMGFTVELTNNGTFFPAPGEALRVAGEETLGWLREAIRVAAEEATAVKARAGSGSTPP